MPLIHCFVLKRFSIPTYRTFHSLLLHILDSDRAKWFMVCNKYAFPHVSLPEFGLYFLLYLDVSVSLGGLYELRAQCCFLYGFIFLSSPFSWSSSWLLVCAFYSSLQFSLSLQFNSLCSFIIVHIFSLASFCLSLCFEML